MTSTGLALSASRSAWNEVKWTCNDSLCMNTATSKTACTETNLVVKCIIECGFTQIVQLYLGCHVRVSCVQTAKMSSGFRWNVKQVNSRDLSSRRSRLCQGWSYLKWSLKPSFSCQKYCPIFPQQIGLVGQNLTKRFLLWTGWSANLRQVFLVQVPWHAEGVQVAFDFMSFHLGVKLFVPDMWWAGGTFALGWGHEST